MIRKGNTFTHFNKPIEVSPFFERIELLYFTDITFGNFLLHTHNYLELILILDGDVEMLIGDKRYHVSKGSLISIPPGSAHHTIIPPDTTRYERMVLHIFQEYLDSLSSWCHLAPDRFHFLKQPRLLEYEPENFWMFRTLFERAYSVISQDTQYQQIVIPCLVIEFFMEMELRLHRQAAPPIPATNNLVTAVVDYIDEHFSEPGLTLEDIRRPVFVSQGYLSRIFKSYTGTSIYSYLTSKRLIYAKELLSSGSTVLDACINCGFSNYTCFLKAFKKSYGITPAAFRSKNKTPPPNTPPPTPSHSPAEIYSCGISPKTAAGAGGP